MAFSRVTCEAGVEALKHPSSVWLFATREGVTLSEAALPGEGNFQERAEGL